MYISALLTALAFGLVSAITPSAFGPAGGTVIENIPYVDAKPILDALREDLLPAEVRTQTPAEREAAWPGWVSRRDAEIRARLDRGDQDSVVNLLLFGVTFTKLPRSTERDLFSGRARDSKVVQGRIEDLIAGVASPGTNERLRFVRQLVERRGVDPMTAAGKRQVRQFLVEALGRVLADYGGVFSDLGAAGATLFQDRGLSSDTSMFCDFAIEQALENIKSKGMLGAGSVRRVAIVGPGLDFVDKREGYDFYPQQTIQPFAVVDSLIRLGLAKADDLHATTFDLSPRVNQHLEAARERARAGSAYLLHLPRDTTRWWNPKLVTYWERFGDRIGQKAKAAAPPSPIGTLHVRAVRIRPAVVRSIVAEDANIVLQRFAPLASDDRFDLIIATNILIYYDVFEQSLAAANVAKMLRPGGFFLSTNPIFELPPTPLSAAGYTDVVYTDRQDSTDRIVWYERQ